jgi:type I restriction enzyme M protein
MMSEELLQRGLDRKNPTAKIGKWDYFNIGATSLKALKVANIIRNVDYGLLEAKKVDALIVNQKDVVAIIEFKQPKEFKTAAQKNKAIQQEIDVARKLGAKVIIATDTVDTLWVNALTGEQITDEDGQNLTTPFNTSDENLASLIEKITASISEKNNQILPPELVDPTGLARSIWQDVWSVTGATPENCLYTFVELFIFKYLSDLGVLKSTDSFGFLMSMYDDDRTDKEVLEYYVGTIRIKIKKLFPEGDDKTTIINGTIFVSKDQQAVEGYSTVFRKVLEKFKKHKSLEHIDYDFKSKLFESFLKESISKKNWGQFFTPMKVVRAIETIAKDEIKEGAVICDPACGVGKFLLEPIKSRLDRFYQVQGDKVISKITIEGFDKGFDKDEQKTIILAKANMLIYFSEIIKNYPNHTKEFAEIFNKSFTLKTNSILGTLREAIEEKYTLILTNPPYVTSGSSNLKEEIQKDSELKKYYKINAIGVEGLFMEWIVRALKPNGKAFIIVPDGIFNRQNDKNLREFLRLECFIDGIISLPLNTFFTTSKKTYILCLTKKNNRSDVQTDPVFTYLVSEIGESRDVYRFNIEQNDLNEATTLYNFFKGNKSGFSAINKDPRCKVVPIDDFKPEENWSVDRWWSKEEKVALGIEGEIKVLDVLGFSSLVSDIADTLGGFSTILKEVGEKKKRTTLTFQKVTLNEIIDFSHKTNNSQFTKAFVDKNKGEVPVYSASDNSNLVGYGYVQDNLPQIKYFQDCMTWNIDGSIGQVFIRKGRFSLSEKVVPLILFQQYENQLDKSFLKYAIEQQAKQEGFGFTNKAGKAKLAKMSISIPLNGNGIYDLELQQDIVEKYNVVTDLKAKIVEYEKTLKDLTILIENETTSCQVVKISDIFETKKGFSKYTRTYGQSNSGDYPVYSGSTNAPIMHISSYDYSGDVLSWVVDGLAGYMQVLSGKYSATGHRGLMFLKIADIDIYYIKHILEPVLRALAKGRKGDKGKNEYTNVTPSVVESVTISIPTLPNGCFDIARQNEIAESYRKAEEVKALLLLELQKIKSVSIDI